jgi:hypothetical protein
MWLWAYSLQGDELEKEDEGAAVAPAVDAADGAYEADAAAQPMDVPV